MRLSGFGMLWILTALSVMMLHSMVPHHHDHHADRETHHHDATGHHHDQEADQKIPLSHGEHADFTFSVSSRTAVPDVFHSVSDLVFLYVGALHVFANHEMKWPGKSPPSTLIKSLCVFSASGFRAPPAGFFA